MTAPEDPVTPQIIPRPLSARPGRDAPWATLEPERRRGIGLARVAAALEAGGFGLPIPDGPLAGPPHASPVFDGAAVAGRLPVGAAVLVALFEESGETRVVLTRRSAQLRSHTGQVSFPGGKLDPGENALEAALREGEEEVGLPADASSPAGWLRPASSFASGSLIMPVVTTLGHRPELVASPAEVDRVFDVALCDLLDEGVFHEERWSRPERRNPEVADGSYPLWFFDVAGETIWGVTAALLLDLLCVVLDLAP
jgi:8-oxo-dGTP pyrophosphatase MutT (NUDIX family)